VYWRAEKKADRERLVKNEKQIEQLISFSKNKLATKDELIECGKEKDDQHHKGIKDVLIKIDGVISGNADEHGKILEKMNNQHSETLNTIIDLHEGN